MEQMELFILKRTLTSQKFGVLFPKGSLLIKESMGSGSFAYRKAKKSDFITGEKIGSSLYISLKDKDVSPIEWTPLKK